MCLVLCLEHRKRRETPRENHLIEAGTKEASSKHTTRAVRSQPARRRKTGDAEATLMTSLMTFSKGGAITVEYRWGDNRDGQEVHRIPFPLMALEW